MTLTKYLVNAEGVYLGAFSGHQPPPVLMEPEEGEPYYEDQPVEWPEFPDGAIEVPFPPDHGLDKWVNEAWLAHIPIPQIVTRRQARRALLQADLLDHIQPAIDAIIDSGLRAQAQIDWDDATEFKRDDATLILLAQALELSDEQLDQLFIHAAQY